MPDERIQDMSQFHSLDSAVTAPLTDARNTPPTLPHRRGPKLSREAAKRGGRSTRDKWGTEHFRRIGAIGGAGSSRSADSSSIRRSDDAVAKPPSARSAPDTTRASAATAADRSSSVRTPQCSMRAIECIPQSPVEGRQLYASSLAALAAKGDDLTTVGLAKRWV
jgi:hypothetical protein